MWKPHVQWGRTGAFLVVLAGLVSCSHRDEVAVRVTFRAPAGTPSLEDVRVFAGASKSSWPTVAAGETVHVALPPEGEPDLTATFRQAGVKRSWQGPPLTPGVGYVVAIVIGTDGAVTETRCVKPCSLP
ncbi:MAG: hypothetical protein ACJ8F1_17640 [Polyangia bacterium]